MMRRDLAARLEAVRAAEIFMAASCDRVRGFAFVAAAIADPGWHASLFTVR